MNARIQARIQQAQPIPVRVRIERPRDRSGTVMRRCTRACTVPWREQSLQDICEAVGLCLSPQSTLRDLARFMAAPEVMKLVDRLSRPR